MSTAAAPTEQPTVLLAVKAQVFPPRTLFLREGLATATLPTGEAVEVSINVSGGILVRIGEGDWFALGPRALIDSVLAHQRSEVRT